MPLLASVLVLALVYPGSQAYSTGPPPSSCRTLFPLHGVEKQTGTPPYHLVLSASTYMPNQTLSLRVESLQGNQSFMGFQVTAHRVRDSGNHEQFVGTFTVREAHTQTLDCLRAPKSMVTHNNATLKTTVTFDWTAPDMNVGDLQFFLTVVENKDTFWIRMPFTLQARSTAPVVPPPTIVPSVSLSTGPPDWSTCYQTKGCWLVAENRRGQCGMAQGECLAAMSYRQEGGKFVFELSYKTEGQYFALGLSDDRFMGDDLAVVCTANPGHESVQLGFNHGVPGPYKYFFRQFSTGLSDLAVGQANGHSYCKFSLVPSITLLNMTLSRPYNLMQRYYLFLSWGRIFQGTIDIYGHSGPPAVSESQVYLMDQNAFYSSAVTHVLTCTVMLASIILALILH